MLSDETALSLRIVFADDVPARHTDAALPVKPTKARAIRPRPPYETKGGTMRDRATGEGERAGSRRLGTTDLLAVGIGSGLFGGIALAAPIAIWDWVRTGHRAFELPMAATAWLFGLQHFSHQRYLAWPLVIGAALLVAYAVFSGLAFTALADRVYRATRPLASLAAGGAWAFVSFIFFWDMLLPIAPRRRAAPRHTGGRPRVRRAHLGLDPRVHTARVRHRRVLRRSSNIARGRRGQGGASRDAFAPSPRGLIPRGTIPRRRSAHFTGREARPPGETRKKGVCGAAPLDLFGGSTCTGGQV